MAFHQRFPNAPEIAPAREIGGLVDTECRQSANMARLATCLREDGQYVFERLFELRNELLAFEFMIGILVKPPGHKHNASGRRHTETVDIAYWWQPAGWMKHLR